MSGRLKIALFFVIMVVPGLLSLVTTQLAFSRASSVEFCGSCHTMTPWFQNVTDPESDSLAAEHFKRRWIQHEQCFTCHSNYSFLGPMEAKIKGVRHVAAFYASKTAKPGAAKNKDTIRLGERIWRGGIADKAVPACAGCHGPTGAGIPAQYPRLGGQHGDYTELQMNTFRAGTRANSAQMMTIAAKLSDKEIKAVSDYATGLR